MPALPKPSARCCLPEWAGKSNRVNRGEVQRTERWRKRDSCNAWHFTLNPCPNHLENLLFPLSEAMAAPPWQSRQTTPNNVLPLSTNDPTKVRAFPSLARQQLILQPEVTSDIGRRAPSGWWDAMGASVLTAKQLVIDLVGNVCVPRYHRWPIGHGMNPIAKGPLGCIKRQNFSSTPQKCYINIRRCRTGARLGTAMMMHH